MKGACCEKRYRGAVSKFLLDVFNLRLSSLDIHVVAPDERTITQYSMVISYFDHHSKQIVCVCMFPTQSKPSHYTYTTTFIFFVLVSPLVLVSPGAVRPPHPLSTPLFAGCLVAACLFSQKYITLVRVLSSRPIFNIKLRYVQDSKENETMRN